MTLSGLSWAVPLDSLAVIAVTDTTSTTAATPVQTAASSALAQSMGLVPVAAFGTMADVSPAASDSFTVTTTSAAYLFSWTYQV
jgi:hypothetical protein